MFLLLAVFAAVAACSNSASVLIPRAHPTAPSVKPGTPSPVPTAIPSGGQSAAQVSATLQSTESFYLTLPHTNPVADINAVASQMVSSGAYKSATVTPGGITATLPDGSLAVIFTDSLEDLGLTNSANSQRAANQSEAQRVRAASLSGPTSHEIAFLTLTSDTNTFQSKTDGAYEQAFVADGFTAAGYGVDVASISLDNIVALGNQHPIDFLNLSTHGMVAGTPGTGGAGAPFTFMLDSDTPVNAATKMQYQSDLTAHNIAYAYYLTTDNGLGLVSATYAFTPAFMAENFHFNPGAVINFGSCWSANPTILPALSATLQAAGVGRMYGWTKSTVAVDYYETLAFLLDRILGEQNPSVTGLATYATQRVPVQRPFPLDDTYTTMQTEQRMGPIYFNQAEPYTVSNKGPTIQAINVNQPPLADGPASILIQTDFGGENVANPPIIYSFPSIAQMQTTESATSGTLTIMGHFPLAQGTVQIVDGSGTTMLTVTSWNAVQITATLPASGNGSAGLVTVLSAPAADGLPGIPSNAVPLTQWTGNLTYNESDTLTSVGSGSGSGQGTIVAQYNIAFRSDVHPVVPSIDTSPQPQSFAFSNVEGNSTGALTAYNGTFVTNDKDPKTATFSAASPAPVWQPVLPPLHAGTFEIRAFGGQSAPCGAGISGPSATPNDVFCPITGFFATPGSIQCVDDDSGNLCTPDEISGISSYGGPFDAGGILSFTLNPTTYAITVAGTNVSFTSDQFYGITAATATMGGTVSAPSFPPSETTPALRRRVAARAR